MEVERVNERSEMLKNTNCFNDCNIKTTFSIYSFICFVFHSFAKNVPSLSENCKRFVFYGINGYHYNAEFCY